MSICSESRDTKRLQADSTSLADLKAELHRKKGEAQNNKVKGNFRPEKASDGEKKTNIWSKKNTGLIIRMQRDMEKRKEEERSYERAKYMLEKKTRLYESMKQGKGNSSIADNFLVNFNGGIEDDDDEDFDELVKMDYPARGSGEEWVEYTDKLGRTRKCMKKDLAKLQRQDEDMLRQEEDEQETGEGLRKEEPDMLSADMRMDMLRQKWEQQEMENLTKESLHYSDVQFDEARTHGAGFYNFSGEEDKRIQQQKTLRKLHEETDEMRRLRERKAEKRKKDMSDRIKKIKAKRREKLGLPPESDDDSDNEGNENGDDSDDENQAEDISKSVMEGLKMFRRNNEEMERQRNQALREASSQARDWDRDKEHDDDDLGRRREWKVMSQEQWNSQKREERNPAFAPPTAYSEARYLLKNREKSLLENTERNKKSNIQKPARQMGPPRMPFPPPRPGMMGPPASFPPGMMGPPPSMMGPRASFPPGMMGPPAPPSGPPPLPPGPGPRPVDPMSMLDANPEPAPPPAATVPSYSKAVRLELHKRMQNQDLLPESGLNSKVLEAFADSDSEEEEERPRGRGSEIAPPCDMNYFSSPGTSRSGYRDHHDMAEAFNAGLQANKK